VQPPARRARALREDQHAKALGDALAAGVHHVGGVQRIGGAHEQARAVQQRPPPAAAIQHGLHGRGDVRQRGHERGHVQQARMIGD
jgi:hypothetical protein